MTWTENDGRPLRYVPSYLFLCQRRGTSHHCRAIAHAPRGILLRPQQAERASLGRAEPRRLCSHQHIMRRRQAAWSMEHRTLNASALRDTAAEVVGESRTLKLAAIRNPAPQHLTDRVTAGQTGFKFPPPAAPCHSHAPSGSSRRHRRSRQGERRACSAMAGLHRIRPASHRHSSVTARPRLGTPGSHLEG
jgi:hypothetical protein